MLLQVLEEEGESRAGVLATRLGITQATTTNILDRLEKAGLVQRRRYDSDKRRVLVSLTKEGFSRLSAAPDGLQELFADRFDQLEPWEQSMTIAALKASLSMADLPEIVYSVKKEGRDYTEYRTMVLCQNAAGTGAASQIGKVLSAASFRVHSFGMELIAFATKPEFRAQGNGRMLTAALKSMCARFSIMQVFVSAGDFVVPFWRKMGFTELQEQQKKQV